MVRESGTAECPTSLFAMESKDSRVETSIEFVQEFARATLMNKSFGASPYGPDLREWPAKTLDAFVVLRQEQEKVDSLLISSPKSRGHK